MLVRMASDRLNEIKYFSLLETHTDHSIRFSSSLMEDNKVCEVVLSAFIYQSRHFSVSSVDSFRIWKDQFHFLGKLLQFHRRVMRSCHHYLVIKIWKIRAQKQTFGSSTPAYLYSSSIEENACPPASSYSIASWSLRASSRSSVGMGLFSSRAL